jgi:Arm DNA-binding domain
MPLTDTQCRNLKAIEKARKVSDGGGLFLQIEPTGSKLWRLAYRFEGKQKLLSLGRYPAVSLKDAWGKRDDARELLAKGIDPSIARKAEKAKGKLKAGNTLKWWLGNGSINAGLDWCRATRRGS